MCGRGALRIRIIHAPTSKGSLAAASAPKYLLSAAKPFACQPTGDFTPPRPTAAQPHPCGYCSGTCARARRARSRLMASLERTWEWVCSTEVRPRTLLISTSHRPPPRVCLHAARRRATLSTPPFEGVWPETAATVRTPAKEFAFSIRSQKHSCWHDTIVVLLRCRSPLWCTPLERRRAVQGALSVTGWTKKLICAPSSPLRMRRRLPGRERAGNAPAGEVDVRGVDAGVHAANQHAAVGRRLLRRIDVRRSHDAGGVAELWAQPHRHLPAAR
jgi:hypothetical protein